MRSLKTRAKYIRIFFIVIFLMLSIKLYFLQVMPTEQVTSNYMNHQTEVISDMKYMLFDTKGKDLNNYNKEYLVVIDSKPFKLNNYGEALQGLLTFNFIMKEEIENFSFDDIMKAPHGKNYYNVSKETFDKVNNIKNVKGVYTYVYDKRDSKEAWSIDGMFSNLDNIQATEGSLDYMIKSEIENNEFPKVNFYRDDNTVYTNKKLVQEEKNKNVKLTVDKELQTKIKKVTLDKKYEKYENIGVILLESKSGKIRSLTQKDESEANINLGMEGIGYEPGSIFKLITYGIALEEGAITPETAYTCRGKKCKNVFHGNISSKKALVESCNDIFGYIGGEIGSEVLLDYSKKLGMFERVLNIDSKNKSEAKGTYMREDAGVDNLAIGQSMTVTPIQITGAINTFVNDGIYIRPSIVEGITDSEGNVIQEMKSEGKMIFSKLTSDMVKDGMKDVVLYGTGELAKVNGKEVYGKTGSGTFQNETHCWFTGAFEINGVKYTMSVVVPNVEEEKGKIVGGSTVAAPIFSDIVKELEK